MNFLSTVDLGKAGIMKMVKDGAAVKKDKYKYGQALEEKSILLLFETVSLRTKLSFTTAMTQLGGHAIFYHTEESTLGKKETIKEFTGSACNYVDGIVARLFEHRQLEEMAHYSKVPVINAMTNYEHPCQILGDLLTIYEKFKGFRGLKLAYVGDGLNNVTHSLLFGCSMVGMDIVVACPKGKDFEPKTDVVKKASVFADENNSSIIITQDPKQAVKGADIVYTDSWMSYRIPHVQESRRVRIFSPYQVNSSLMSLAHDHAVFMHCLPAKRGHEVTNNVIDSKQSIIFQQAGNRLHAQKALLMHLLPKKKQAR